MEPTLLELLEGAAVTADSYGILTGQRMHAFEVTRRLRAAAARLREEIAKAERLSKHWSSTVEYTYQSIGVVLERINAGPSHPITAPPAPPAMEPCHECGHSRWEHRRDEPRPCALCLCNSFDGTHVEGGRLIRSTPIQPPPQPASAPTCPKCSTALSLWSEPNSYDGPPRYWCPNLACENLPLPEPLGAQPTSGTPMCASWCGKLDALTPIGAWPIWDGDPPHGYCTPACRDAGKPLHPAQQAPVWTDAEVAAAKEAAKEYAWAFAEPPAQQATGMEPRLSDAELEDRMNRIGAFIGGARELGISARDAVAIAEPQQGTPCGTCNGDKWCWLCVDCGHLQPDTYDQGCDKCHSDNIVMKRPCPTCRGTGRSVPGEGR